MMDKLGAAVRFRCQVWVGKRKLTVAGSSSRSIAAMLLQKENSGG